MDHDSTETSSDSGDETFPVHEKISLAENLDLLDDIRTYVKKNPKSPNTQLFSFLALLNIYVPTCFLLKSECQKVLGPPDLIYGGPPFEVRMAPFMNFINTSSPKPDHDYYHLQFAEKALELLVGSGISRSSIVKKFMSVLCGDQAKETTVEFIKELLTKRKTGTHGKEKFSRLIEDISKKEIFDNAASVLETASYKMRQIPIYPQTLSRLYYIKRGVEGYDSAEIWAKTAIERAPNNSYVADTLGQIYKNRLLNLSAYKQPKEILNMMQEALKVFKDVEKKADREEWPEMTDEGNVSNSNTFNNRGRFGFIQVAEIAFEKLKKFTPDPLTHLPSLEEEVKAKFDFFEWYLCYSKPTKTTTEPKYFWKDVALCYEHYTGNQAADSISFSGLLECLNHGLFTSKGRRARFREVKKTTSDLEAICNDMKTNYEANVEDVKAAERYILSNIILSNKQYDSPKLTPVKELQTILSRFLDTEVGHRSPEFYLLVLLLFWPEGPQPQSVEEEEEEEVEQPATEDNGSDNETSEDEDRNEEQESEGAPAQDLQQHIAFMEQAYKRVEYAKYLRGRYLVPLFFLGKGSGLSKWVHKSRLDAIVERKVDAELANIPLSKDRTKKKCKWINGLWRSGKVWQVPEIQAILLGIEFPTPQDQEQQELLVFLRERKICTITRYELNLSMHPKVFYLGFTIQGPVFFDM